jgi:hypothetical protein
MKTTALLIAFILAVSPAVLNAADGNGGQPAAFRDLKIGGRASAMGGAYTAVAEGGVGHMYNPAGLAQSRLHEFSFSYRAMHIDRRLGFASLAIPAKENARIAISWLYAGSPDLETRDEMGVIIPGENISYSENLVGVTFAKSFIPELLVGGKLFYVQNNVAGVTAYTVGVDAGVMAKLDVRKTFLSPLFPLFQAGLAAENLGASYRWTTQKYWQDHGRETGATVDESFPANFRLGAALVQPEKYLVAADFEVNTASLVKTHFGGEYTINRTLALRAGLDNLHPTFGAGFFRVVDRVGMRIDVSYLLDKVGEGDDVLFSFDVMF